MSIRDYLIERYGRPSQSISASPSLKSEGGRAGGERRSTYHYQEPGTWFT
jgi:hypothetical protein